MKQREILQKQLDAMEKKFFSEDGEYEDMNKIRRWKHRFGKRLTEESQVDTSWISKDRIDEVIPDISEIKERYRPVGECKTYVGRIETLRAAYLDARNGTLNCELYAVGEARPEYLYYLHDGCYDITDAIEKYLLGEWSREEAVNEAFDRIQ